MFRKALIVLCVSLSLAAGIAKAQLPVNDSLVLSTKFTMPQGLDPDKKLFFSFDGESQTFTGFDLLTGSSGNPGVEFHVVQNSSFQVYSIELSLDSALVNTNVLGTVLTDVNTSQFSQFIAPWVPVAYTTSFPLVITWQSGAVKVGQIVSDLGEVFGEAYGSLTLLEYSSTNPNLDFSSLVFRAKVNGGHVPEPGTLAMLTGLLMGGALVFKRRRA